MRVVFTGKTFCDYRTFQRLVLVADEIGFIDRPSVTFEKWGTVGSDSEIRRYKTDDLPVKLSAFEPPSGPAHDLYSKFIERDIANPAFVQVIAEGLTRDESFARKFIQLEADYGDGMKGRDILQALTDDETLAKRIYSEPENTDFRLGVKTSEGREHIFKMNLIDASIQVTSGMFIAEETGLTPVTDDPYFSKLLALRAADPAYLGRTGFLAAPLGLAIAKAVIPDAALEQLNIAALMEYRVATEDAYKAWAVEMERLATSIAETEPDKIEKRIRALIASDITPKILQYKNDMMSARDKLFGDLIKKIVTWEMPSLMLAYVGEFSLNRALTVFAAAATPAVPAIVDYYQNRRELVRKNSLSYLIGLTKSVK